MVGKSKISVEEALAKLNQGSSLDGFTVDFDVKRIKAMDAYKLGKNGVDVPEDKIYYDDNDIAYDADFDEYEWVRVEEDPLEMMKEKIQVDLDIDHDVKEWIDQNNIQVKGLIEKLIHNFYTTNKLVKKSN